MLARIFNRAVLAVIRGALELHAERTAHRRRITDRSAKEIADALMGADEGELRRAIKKEVGA